MQLSYGEQRSEMQKAYDQDVMDRVRRGIALLFNKYGPDWVDKIDMKTLDLSSGSRCVLGQLYADKSDEGGDGYDYGAVALEIDDEEVDYGFDAEGFQSSDYDALNAAWEDALTALKRDAV